VLAVAVDASVAVRRAAGFSFRSDARQLVSFAAFLEARTERSAGVPRHRMGGARPIRVPACASAGSCHSTSLLPPRGRPRPRGTAGGLRCREAFPSYAVHPLAGADWLAGVGGVSFRVPDAAARHLQHPLCAAGVHRVARVGGHPPPAGRHHTRRLGDPVLEIPQEPPRPAARDRPSRTRAIPPTPPSVCAGRASRLRLAAAETALAPRSRSRLRAARAIGLPDSPRARPTPHSLRHAFAVRALQACPDGRDAITRHMLALSTYLGHAKVADTYWHLEAVPKLMTDIADRCERFVMGGRS
jgi:hypothetical protein